MERLGILGGTFDPPHLAHLILASVAYDAMVLDRVLFVPAAAPPHKQGHCVTAIEHRLVMLRLAIDDDPRFAISRVDVDRMGPHFSADMVALVQVQYPQADLHFLMGSDALRELPSWYRVEQLLRSCRLVVLPRPGVAVARQDLIAVWGALHERITFIEGPSLDLSATQVRQRRQDERSLRYLVPDRVLAYINDHHLYE